MGGFPQPLLANGSWSLAESQIHISLLELKAIRYTLLSFSVLLEGKKVLMATDNTMAKAYLNKQGGTTSLVLVVEATYIGHWAIVRLIPL